MVKTELPEPKVEALEMTATAAQKQKAYRQRRRDHVAVLPVAVDLFAVTDMLLETGRLAIEELQDRAAVAAAVTALVEDFTQKFSVAGNARRPPSRAKMTP